MTYLSLLQTFLVLVSEPAVSLHPAFTLSSSLSSISAFSQLIAYYNTYSQGMDRGGGLLFDRVEEFEALRVYSRVRLGSWLLRALFVVREKWSEWLADSADKFKQIKWAAA